MTRDFYDFPGLPGVLSVIFDAPAEDFTHILSLRMTASRISVRFASGDMTKRFHTAHGAAYGVYDLWERLVTRGVLSEALGPYADPERTWACFLCAGLGQTCEVCRGSGSMTPTATTVLQWAALGTAGILQREALARDAVHALAKFGSPRPSCVGWFPLRSAFRVDALWHFFGAGGRDTDMTSDGFVRLPGRREQIPSVVLLNQLASPITRLTERMVCLRSPTLPDLNVPRK